MARCMKCGGNHNYQKGGSSFPDLTGDGKVTYADILKGRGAFKRNGGSSLETGMMKYGGSCGKKMKYNRISKSF